MTDIIPMPRGMEGACCRCGGDVHIYDHIQDTPEGMVCGDCTRAEENRKGRDPRAIDKHFKWKHGHDPNDPEADENSPYFYLNLQQTEEKAPPSQKDGLGGPPAGVPCFNCLSGGRGLVEARFAAAVDPYSLLEPTGYKLKEDTPRTKEKVIITICATCSSVVHWREEEFKRARERFSR